MNTATLEKYLKTSNNFRLLENLPNIKNCKPCRYIINELNTSQEPREIYLASLAAVAPCNPLVFVQGGTLPANSELSEINVADFQIGKFAVTMEEWVGVRDFAIALGPEFEIIPLGSANSTKHPVTDISWVDAVNWCNAKSYMEGLEMVYQFNNGELKEYKANANGYRLPNEAEWEWAARGGQKSKGSTYAGSNDLNAVAWHKKNSRGAAHPVGEKSPNELGLFDMSGNVWEWCWDLYGTSYRLFRGGGWDSSENYHAVACRGFADPDDRSIYQGFRLARSL